MLLDPTAAFRAQARRRAARLAAMDPLAAQTTALQRLLTAASGTAFGRAHGLAAIRSVRDYQHAVPIRSWERMWDEWWRPAFPILDGVSWPGRMPFFAETSGTTAARAKHIPVSRDMVRSNRRAALDVVLDHLNRSPSSRFFGGPSLVLGGSSRLTRLARGVRSGDLSGIAAATMPVWTAGRALPKRSIALLGDWDEKLDRIARDAIGRDLRCVTGTPSWLLLLFERLMAATGAPDVATLFPSLELVIHGGVGFAPYRARFERLLGGRARTEEVYPASEGFVAYADGQASDGALRLLLDNGLFFEFVPPDQLDAASPTRHWIGDAEIGRDYALVLTTNAGLFGYVLGDVVRLVSRRPARIIITGRTRQMLSAFGEHLSGGELDRAVETAARSLDVAVSEYTASALPPTPQDARGGHLFVVECAGGARPDPQAFGSVLERVLADGNDDYAAHRAGGHGLRPTAVRFVPAGRFAGWMRARGRHGGQHKVPRVLDDPALLAALLKEDEP